MFCSRADTNALICTVVHHHVLSCSSVGKASTCNEGDLGSIPGSGRSPGEGNGNPLQYSCLENPMDRGTWQATFHGIARVGHDLALFFFLYTMPAYEVVSIWELLTR